MEPMSSSPAYFCLYAMMASISVSNAFSTSAVGEETPSFGDVLVAVGVVRPLVFMELDANSRSVASVGIILIPRLISARFKFHVAVHENPATAQPGEGTHPTVSHETPAQANRQPGEAPRGKNAEELPES